MEIKKIDRFEFIRAYLGFGFLTWWGIWCYNNCFEICSHLSGFIISLGGIL
jgi:hypothetical protein